jgi:hypothetical protein
MTSSQKRMHPQPKSRWRLLGEQLNSLPIFRIWAALVELMAHES